MYGLRDSFIEDVLFIEWKACGRSLTAFPLHPRQCIFLKSKAQAPSPAKMPPNHSILHATSASPREGCNGASTWQKDHITHASATVYKLRRDGQPSLQIRSQEARSGGSSGLFTLRIRNMRDRERERE